MKKTKSTRHKMGTQPMPKGGKSYRTRDDQSHLAPPRKKFAGVSEVARKKNLAVE